MVDSPTAAALFAQIDKFEGACGRLGVAEVLELARLLELEMSVSEAREVVQCMDVDGDGSTPPAHPAHIPPARIIIRCWFSPLRNPDLLSVCLRPSTNHHRGGAGPRLPTYIYGLWPFSLTTMFLSARPVGRC